jgi:ABC-2 type transport system permease protein
VAGWIQRWSSPALRALYLKEFSQIRRDRRIIVALVVPPILQLMLFGTVMSPDVPTLRLGIMDESRSSQSRALTAALTESGTFEREGDFESVQELGDKISQGTIDAGIVIPYDLGRDLDRARPVTVQVLLNAMNANTAAVSQGYIQGVIGSFNRTLMGGGDVRASVSQLAASSAPAVRRGSAILHPAFLFNPGLITSWFLVTGLLGQLFLMNGMITMSSTMVKEREAGTLEQLLMTPARISEIIVAKIVPPFIMMGIPVAMALAVVRLYFQVPFRGSGWLLVVASASCLMCGIGIGTVVATLTKSAQQAQLSSFFIMPPMLSLSGAMTPAEAMPGWMRPWTAINPIYHFGVIARGTMIRGSGLVDLWPNLLALFVFALVLMSISVWRFRQQLS